MGRQEYQAEIEAALDDMAADAEERAEQDDRWLAELMEIEAQYWKDVDTGLWDPLRVRRVRQLDPEFDRDDGYWDDDDGWDPPGIDDVRLFDTYWEDPSVVNCLPPARKNPQDVERPMARSYEIEVHTSDGKVSKSRIDQGDHEEYPPHLLLARTLGLPTEYIQFVSLREDVTGVMLVYAVRFDPYLRPEPGFHRIVIMTGLR